MKIILKSFHGFGSSFEHWIRFLQNFLKCFAWFETNWDFRFERIYLKLSGPPTTHRLEFPLLFWCVSTSLHFGDSLRLHGICVLSPGNLCLSVLESGNAWILSV